MSKRKAAEPVRSEFRPRRRGGTAALALLVLVVLDLAMFIDVLGPGSSRVLSAGRDINREFLHVRRFGFQQLQQGNLALWNPHIFGGAPFFGTFQPALLYPPNWLYLALPLEAAMNVGIALHVLLAGLGMYAWGRWRGLSVPAGLLAAVLVMFGGAHFLHIYPGHLSNLCTMAWAPLVFLSAEAWGAGRGGPDEQASPMGRTRPWPWLLLGMGAVAMQVLAGHPQYVFFTAVAVVVYVLADVIRGHGRLRRLLGLAGIYAGGAALSGVQLLAGVSALSGGLRQGRLPRAFAAESSFAPESLLTMLAPTFFGVAPGDADRPYWGRSYLWEECAYLGVAALLLVGYGALRARTGRPRRLAAVALVLFVLALGAHTPLFEITWRYLPLFGNFRGHGKFIFFVSLMLAMLAGLGLDELAVRRGRRRAAAAVSLGAAGVLLVGGLAVWQSGLAPDGGWWRGVMEAVHRAGETFTLRPATADASTIRSAAGVSAAGLLTAAGLLAAGGVLMGLAGRRRAAAYLLVLLAAGEVFVVARGLRPTFVPTSASLPAAASARLLGQSRVLDDLYVNEVMSVGALNAWGSGPEVRLRTAQFVAFTQRQDVGEVTQRIYWERFDRMNLLRLLRVDRLFVRTGHQIYRGAVAQPLAHLNLVSDWRVVSDPQARLEAMLAPEFDPSRTVLLEQDCGLGEASKRDSSGLEPLPPAAGGQGRVELVEASTDYLVIHAETSTPAILLVTDSYDDDWVAQALPGSDQAAYQVLPADHCLRGVPLRPGRHRLVMRYDPWGYRWGRWVSLAAVVLYAAAWGLWLARGRGAARDRPSGSSSGAAAAGGRNQACQDAPVQ